MATYIKFPMVLIVCILLSLHYSLVSGMTYYVSTAGNDNNDGLSEQTAWKTLAKVQTEANTNRTFGPGDVIAFKGGDNFYGNLYLDNVDGINGNPIIITSYGVGGILTSGF